MTSLCIALGVERKWLAAILARVLPFAVVVNQVFDVNQPAF